MYERNGTSPSRVEQLQRDRVAAHRGQSRPHAQNERPIDCVRFGAREFQ